MLRFRRGGSRGRLMERGLWWGLVAVFVVAGLRGGYRMFQQQGPGAPGSWESLDASLGDWDLPSPSVALRDSLRESGPGAVLFVGTLGEPSFSLTYYSVSYLAWPRVVGGLLCGAQDRQAIPYVPIEDRVTTVLFFRREPPDFLGPSTPIGRYVRQVSERERRDWTQYCLR